MGVQIREYVSDDDVTLRYRYWAGEPASDGLVYLHGIESHSEWFAECADKIAEKGITVYALDRRGSGLNPEARGHCDSFMRLIGDVVRCVDSIGDSHRRVHAVALSWGAKLAVATDMLHPGTFTTMTLIAPGIFSRVMPRVSERAAIAVDAFLRPHALHPIPIRDEMFTTIRKYRDYIAGDPLRLRTVTARFFF